jgi:hypothetical protein
LFTKINRAMARVSFSGIAIFIIITIESVVSGETLRGSSQPSPASVSSTQTEAPVTSVVVAQTVGFGTGSGAGVSVAETKEVFGDKQIAAAMGARKGPRMPVADASIAAASPGLRPVPPLVRPNLTKAATGTENFLVSSGPESRLQLLRAKIAQAWAGIHWVVLAASALQIGASSGASHHPKKEELAFTALLSDAYDAGTVCIYVCMCGFILGVLVMLTGAGWWLSTACVSSPQKTYQRRKPSNMSNDPLAYAFAARSLGAQQTASVGSWLPCAIQT